MDTRIVTAPRQPARKPLIIVVAAGAVLVSAIAGATWIGRDSGGSVATPAVNVQPAVVPGQSFDGPRAGNPTGAQQIWLVADNEQAELLRSSLVGLPPLEPNIDIEVVGSEDVSASYNDLNSIRASFGESPINVIDLRPR